MPMFNFKTTGSPVPAEHVSKRAEYNTLKYIAFVNVILLVLIGITVFSMPKIINANSNNSNISPFDVANARKRMLSYRDVSLKPFEKEVPGFFDIFPEPSYPEDTSLYGNSGHFSPGSPVTTQAWNRAFSLYAQGLIYGADAARQCTFFAQMWFYDIYGMNSSRGPTGSGGQFANTVYSDLVYYDEDGNLQHYFELGDRPMTMGIVSVYSSSNPYGHVLCVDEVDYFNDTITISEGNVYGNGDCRIRQTMSLAEFYALNPGYKVYANPTPAIINKINAE